MKKQEGKSRNFSQKVGELGESAFAVWATRRGMSANKVGSDYGIDYFCEVFDHVGPNEIKTGETFAVQVRAVAGIVRRLRLDRDDSEAGERPPFVMRM